MDRREPRSPCDHVRSSIPVAAGRRRCRRGVPTSPESLCRQESSVQRPPRARTRREAPGAGPAGGRTPRGRGPWRASGSASGSEVERHLTNIRQLTFSGENAEAYFSPDDSRLIFQTTRPPEIPCDQIFTMKVDGTDMRRVSTGTGRTTCGFFYPDNAHILFASTHLRSPECPPRPGYERGYVWPVYPGYDIFRANADGSNLQQLTFTDGYDAEATIGPDGRIVFTSVRDGDMEIYSMNGDGSDVRRLTRRPGPDGGPFFSRDGKQIVFRGRPSQGPELTDYLGLLKDGLWRPTQLEIYVMNSDGSNVRQVTKNG